MCGFSEILLVVNGLINQVVAIGVKLMYCVMNRCASSW